MLLTTSVPCSSRCFCSSVPTKWRWERCLRRPMESCHRSFPKTPPSAWDSSPPAHCTPITGALCRAAIQPCALAWLEGKRLPEKVSTARIVRRLKFFISDSWLERESRAKLDLTTGCGGFRDRSKLRCVDEAIRCAEIHMIECVKSLGPYLELDLLRNRKLTLQRQIESLTAGTIDRVSSDVTEGESSGSRECRRVEPLIRCLRPCFKNRSA